MSDLKPDGLEWICEGCEWICEGCEFADLFTMTCGKGNSQCRGTDCDDYEPSDKEVL